MNGIDTREETKQPDFRNFDLSKLVKGLDGELYYENGDRLVPFEYLGIIDILTERKAFGGIVKVRKGDKWVWAKKELDENGELVLIQLETVGGKKIQGIGSERKAFGGIVKVRKGGKRVWAKKELNQNREVVIIQLETVDGKEIEEVGVQKKAFGGIVTVNIGDDRGWGKNELNKEGNVVILKTVDGGLIKEIGEERKEFGGIVQVRIGFKQFWVKKELDQNGNLVILDIIINNDVIYLREGNGYRKATQQELNSSQTKVDLLEVLGE